MLSGQTSSQLFVLTIGAEPPATKTGFDTYTIKSGSDVFVKLELTNASRRELVLGNGYDSRFGVDRLNLYEIRDINGNAPRKRTIKHPEIGPTFHGWPARVLEAGATTVLGSDRITGLYDLTQPGRYTIQASRVVSQNPKAPPVRSNSITLIVTE